MQASPTTPISVNSSWKETLAAPRSGSHILQIYDNQDFLAAAVAHFAAEGLRRGEAVILTGTKEHRHRIRAELHARGVDAAAAAHRRQLAFADVHQALGAASIGGRVDPEQLQQVALHTLHAVNPEAPGVRWWGEHSSTLYYQGHRASALAAEATAAETLGKRGVILLCSFLYDRFDPQGYGGVLNDMCCAHSHLIPAEDYVRHRMAVNRAITEVLGGLRGTLLQSLASWKGLGCELPSSQAVLFWLRETLPDHFEEVLARARAYHAT